MQQKSNAHQKKSVGVVFLHSFCADQGIVYNSYFNLLQPLTY